jgi:short-subunit dehydrogenase
MDDNFKDKTVIITGGSEGVGAATARRFAAAGANLVLAARGKKKLDKIAEELRPITNVVIMAMDVCDSDACSNLFRKAAFEFGNINVLINNAGMHKRGPVETNSHDDLGMMIDVNLKAPIILCRLALPYLRESNDGAIINVASLAGRVPVPGAAAYSASKFGLRAFTFALADEIRGSNIKVAAVSPGTIDTGFITSNIDVVTDLNFSQPISTAEEVAEQIVRLCVNTKRERSIPQSSGLLTMAFYLFPALARALRPHLEKKGRRAKRKFKAKIRAAEREAERESDS